MLILSRRVGESLMIGDNIELKVVKSRGGQVRLAIAAPEEVSIIRGELVTERRLQAPVDTTRTAANV